MRLHQLRTLAWAVNAGVIVVATWTGTVFLDAHEARGQSAHVRWPGDASPSREVESGVVRDMLEYAVAWTVPVDGFVPAPPREPPPPPDPTPAEVFLASTSVSGGFLHANPWRSQVRVVHGGDVRTLRPGGSVGTWQLVRVGIEPESGALVASFRSTVGPLHEVVDIREPEVVRPPIGVGDLAEPAHPAWEVGGPIERVPERDVVTEQAFFDADAGVWRVPSEEIRWWLRWGADHVLARAAVRAPAGGGVQLAAPVTRGSPLRTDHGLRAGDVVRSVSDQDVRSPDDLVAAVRRGLRRGRVEFVLRGADGAARSVVWERIEGRSATEKR